MSTIEVIQAAKQAAAFQTNIIGDQNALEFGIMFLIGAVICFVAFFPLDQSYFSARANRLFRRRRRRIS